MSATLRIAHGFTLPVDIAGEAVAILAKRGAGKTNTGRVIVEQLIRADVQSVVLDPVGAWWGLRYGRDGKSRGLPLPIIGGAHGDVPLEPTAGKLIADLAVDSGESLVVDLSDFPTKQAMATFTLAFAERLYARKGRASSPLHLVLEEADIFAPQSPKGGWGGDTGKAAAAIETIVRRGRSRGLGVTLITQRSAVLNKDVLTQTDVLILLRTTGPQDIKAVKEWVASRGDEHANEVLSSLPSLADGEAWVWNPERDLLKRVQVRLSTTFDSGATPKAGMRRVEPKQAAAIDLAKLGAEIAATVERAKATDPKELQNRVRGLERQLAERPTETERVEVQVPVEVPVLDDEHVEVLQALVGEIRDVSEAVSALRAVADQIESALRAATARPAQASSPAARERVVPKPRPASRSVEGADLEGEHVKAGARRIVETLARHYPMRVTRAQLGTLTGFKITGGTFQTYFSQLKRLGLIVDEGGEIAVTDDGIRFSGLQRPEPMTTEETLAMWRGALKAGARQMLDELVTLYPNAVDKESLAETVGMTASGGTFQTYLSTLRRNGLVTVDGGEVRASDTLFIGSRA